MKNRFHIILTVLGLFLTGWLLWITLPFSEGGKNTERARDTRKVVHVGGEVLRPGVMEYKDNTTFYSIIVAAGGPTQYGTLRKVRIYRNGKLFRLDLTKDNLKNNEFARPDDVIEVPQPEPVN